MLPGAQVRGYHDEGGHMVGFDFGGIGCGQGLRVEAIRKMDSTHDGRVSGRSGEGLD